MTRSLIFERAVELSAEQRDEYRQLMDAELTAAEQACRGNVVNAGGLRDGWDSWTLWMSNPTTIQRYGTPELLEYLRDHPRTDRLDHERAFLAREGL